MVRFVNSLVLMYCMEISYNYLFDMFINTFLNILLAIN